MYYEIDVYLLCLIRPILCSNIDKKSLIFNVPSYDLIYYYYKCNCFITGLITKNNELRLYLKIVNKQEY